MSWGEDFSPPELLTYLEHSRGLIMSTNGNSIAYPEKEYIVRGRKFHEQQFVKLETSSLLIHYGPEPNPNH